MNIQDMLTELSFAEADENAQGGNTPLNGKYGKWTITPSWLTLEDNSSVRSYQVNYMYKGWMAYSNKQSLDEAVIDVHSQVIEARTNNPIFKN